MISKKEAYAVANAMCKVNKLEHFILAKTTYNNEPVLNETINNIKNFIADSLLYIVSVDILHIENKGIKKLIEIEKQANFYLDWCIQLEQNYKKTKEDYETYKQLERYM